jgi:hypothetical protein
MIKMNRNNVGLFRRDGRSSFRYTASGDQSGNRQLGPDNGNHGIEGDSGWLVHREILRHLHAMGACLSFIRVRGIPILFAGLSFIHSNLQQKTNGQLIEGRRVTPLSAYFSKGDRNFRQEWTISVFFDKPRARNCSGRVLRFDSSRSDVAAPLPWADSRHLAEGAREGGLIAEARLNCYVRNRRGRLPK